jgi:hypothetical protein
MPGLVAVRLTGPRHQHESFRGLLLALARSLQAELQQLAHSFGARWNGILLAAPAFKLLFFLRGNDQP